MSIRTSCSATGTVLYNLLFKTEAAFDGSKIFVGKKTVIVRTAAAEAIAFSVKSKTRGNNDINFLDGHRNACYRIAEAADFGRKSDFERSNY